MKSAGLALLKIVLVVVLGIYVVSQIETRDRLIQPEDVAGAEALVHYGELQGDWQAEDWTFSATTGQEFSQATLPSGWELRPGFFTVLRGIRLGLFGLGVLFWVVLCVIVTYRWQLLLRAVGVSTSYMNALRLCFIGYFFNNAMPGLTGGDIVRAVLVTRGLEANRAKAAMSVLVDRLLGLFSLLLLAAIVLLFADASSEDGPRHLDTVRRAVFLVIGLALVGGGVYLSRRARRVLKVDALLSRLPARQIVAKIDDAITIYRHKLGTLAIALVLSMVLQTFGVLSFWAMARALGAPLAVLDVFVIFPVVQTVSSVPIAPAGWGIGETAYGKFFEWFGSTFTLGVAASILFRLTTQIGFGLAGGVMWILSREHKQGVKLAESTESLQPGPEAEG